MDRPGRPRDADIDGAVLDVALRHLGSGGFAGLSVAGVAAEAGTTRPTVYRRWPTKHDLALAAVAHLAEVEAPKPTDDPHVDLVAELEHFRHCISEGASLPLAGVMLQGEAPEAFRREYRSRLVEPRRARLRSCLERGVTLGLLNADADLEIAGTFLTGSWYAFALAGREPPAEWPRRTADAVWRACDGVPPPRQPSRG